jgi:hypothetical protein
MRFAFRWSGLTSMVGGLVLPFAFLMHPTRIAVQADNPIYRGIHVLAAIAFVLLLITLFHLYMSQTTGGSSSLRRLGCLLVCSGSILEIGFFLVDGFVTPVLASTAPLSSRLVEGHLLLFQHIGLLAAALPLIEGCFAVGAIIIALMILQTQIFPRWTGVWLLGGGVLFGLQMVLPPFVADLSVALLGLGFLEIGYHLVKSSKYYATR